MNQDSAVHSCRFHRGMCGILQRKAPTCVFIFRAEALTEYQRASGIHKCPLQNRDPAWSDVRRQQGVCPQNNSDLTFPPRRREKTNLIQNFQNQCRIFFFSPLLLCNICQRQFVMISRTVCASLLRSSNIISGNVFINTKSIKRSLNVFEFFHFFFVFGILVAIYRTVAI